MEVCGCHDKFLVVNAIRNHVSIKIRKVKKEIFSYRKRHIVKFLKMSCGYINTQVKMNNSLNQAQILL